MTILTHNFESTMLSGCSYDTEAEELTVTSTGGKSYTYIDVPRRTYDELVDARSAGRYFNLVKVNLVQKK